MAFTEERLPYSRLFYFTFFAKGMDAQAAHVALNEDFNPTYDYELEKIRLRLSVAHASVVDFMVYMSHHLNSAGIASYWDQNLLSQAMNGVQDVLYQPDPTLKYFAGDTIHFSMAMLGDSAGNTNKWALMVSGWGVTEAPRG